MGASSWVKDILFAWERCYSFLGAISEFSRRKHSVTTYVSQAKHECMPSRCFVKKGNVQTFQNIASFQLYCSYQSIRFVVAIPISHECLAYNRFVEQASWLIPLRSSPDEEAEVNFEPRTLRRCQYAPKEVVVHMQIWRDYRLTKAELRKKQTSRACKERRGERRSPAKKDDFSHVIYSAQIPIVSAGTTNIFCFAASLLLR